MVGLAEAGQSQPDPQKRAAEQMGVSERWVRRLFQRMKTERDRVVMHQLRGKPNHRPWGKNARG